MSVFTTDGTATVLANRTSGQGRDSNPSGNIDRDVTASVTARFAKYSTTVYTSADVSCDSNHLNACLNKGDKVLLPYMPVAQDGVKVSVADAAASARSVPMDLRLSSACSPVPSLGDSLAPSAVALGVIGSSPSSRKVVTFADGDLSKAWYGSPVGVGVDEA